MRTSKRVAVIRSSFSHHGGVEKVALDTISALLERGAEVVLLTWPHQKWPIQHANLQIVSVGIQRGPRFIQAWVFNRCVMRYLAGNAFDRIFSLDRVSRFTHMHGGGGTHRTFLQIQNANSGFVSRWFRKLSLFHRYTLYIEKQGFSNPLLQSVWCASSLVRADIAKDYGVGEAKLQVFPDGVDWCGIGAVFRERDRFASELMQKHDLSPHSRYLLFLGSGFERKGLDIAIQGIHYLPESYDLLVVGKGSVRPYRQLARRLNVENQVHFLGPQENGWCYAALCQALVLPSRYEPFGLAPAEANAMGIPVLVSDKTGYADWLLEGENGITLKSPMNDSNIRNAFMRLVQLIDNPSLDAVQIRNKTRWLDNARIMDDLICRFFRFDKQHPVTEENMFGAKC